MKIKAEKTQAIKFFLTGLLLTLLFISASIFVYGPTNTAHAINDEINFQGKLTNPNGTNVTDGAYSIVFSIYSVATGGSAIWTETDSVTTASGIFNVDLGNSTALPGSVNFDSASLYLGIKVGSDPEMTPRIQLTAVPQAFDSSELGGLNSSAFAQLAAANSFQTTTNATAVKILQNTTNGNADVFDVQGSGGSSNFIQVTSTAANQGAVTIASLGSNNLNLNSGSNTISVGATTILGTGSIALQGASAGTVAVGNNAVANTIQIGTASVNTGNTQTINIGNLNLAGTTNVVIGTGASATAGSTTLQSQGTLALGNAISPTINVQTATGGTIGIGNNAVANTVDIANATGANNTTVAIGSGVTGSSNYSTVTVGSNNADATSDTTIQGGSGTSAVIIQAASGGTISVGSSSINNIIAIGGTSTTGTITLGQWTGTSGTQLISIGSSVGTGGTQDINIGNSSNGTSTINIGSIAAGATTIQSAGGLKVNTIPTGGTNLLCYNSTGNVVSTCSALSSSNFINNQTTVQAANFYVQAATSGSVAGVLEAYNGGTGDILDLRNGSGALVGSVGYTGNVLLQASTNSSIALQVENTSNASVLTVDTSNNRVNINGDTNVGTLFGNDLFSDNFESGNLSLWSGTPTGAGVTVQSSTVHDGGYAFKDVENDATDGVFTSLNSNDATKYLRLWVYVNSVTLATQPNIASFTIGTNDPVTDVSLNSSGDVCIYNEVTASFAGCSPSALTLNAWHEVEMEETVATPTTGVLQLWVDGTSVYSSTTANNGTTYTNSLLLGTTNATQVMTFYADDLVVSTARDYQSASATIDDGLHVGGSSSFGNNVLIQSSSNSAAAFQVQNASGINVLDVNTTNNNVAIGNSAPISEVQEWNTQGTISTTTQTLSESPHTVGNLMAVAVEIDNTTSSVVSVSGGGITNWKEVNGLTANGENYQIWQGLVTTTGAGTITVTYNVVPSVVCEIVAQEFTAGLGSNTNWSVASTLAQGNAASGTITYPTLTASQSGEMYWGYGSAQGTGAAGFTAGFSYVVTGADDVVAYDPDLISGTSYSPTASQTPSSDTSASLAMTIAASTGTTLAVNGTETVTGANSSTAFQVQNAAGNNVLGTDTNLNHVSIGTSTITSAVQEWNGHGTVSTTTETLADSPDTVGDLMILGDEDLAANNIVSVSGGGVTNWTKVTTAAANNQSIWEGTVTTTGAGTITVTYAAAPSAYCEIVAQEFTAGLGSNTNWSVTTSGSLSNASSLTVTYPTLTSAQSGELYWGYGTVATTGAVGSSSGFSYALLSSTNVVAYDTDTQAGSSYFPTASQSPAGTSGTIAAIISASVGSTLTVNGTVAVTGATSLTAFQVQTAAGASLLNADTSNMRISIGSIGTPVGQLYVGGQIASSALQSTTPSGSPGSQDIISAGKLIYVGDYKEDAFYIYDNTNPASPTLIKKQAENGGGKIQAMALSGHYLYTVDDNSSAHMNIWDVSNPLVPNLVGSIATSGNNNGGIAIDGNMAYVGNNAGVDVFNISNPNNPVHVRLITMTTGQVVSVTSYGRYIYAADDGGGSNPSYVKIIDTTTNTMVGSYELSGGTTGSFGLPQTSLGPNQIYVQGQWVYAANYDNGKIDMFNMDTVGPANGASATTAPTYSVSTGSGIGPNSVMAQGRYLYATLSVISTGTSPVLATYDISQIGVSTPTQVGTTALNGYGTSLTTDGRYAYVATWTSGWQTFDLGGTYTQQLEAGGIETGTLNVDNDATINGNANINGSATVGQNLQVTNSASIGSNTYDSISAVAGGTWENGAVSLSTLSVSPENIGDLLILNLSINSGGAYQDFPTSITGGGVTNWHQVISTNQGNGTNAIYYGTVTSTGSSTINVTYSWTNTTQTELDAQEFTAGSGANTYWSSTGNFQYAQQGASTSVTWPSLTTPAQAHELYWGYATTANTVTPTPTAGFTYTSTPYGFAIAYDPSLAASTTYAPTGTQTAGFESNVAALFSATSQSSLTVNGPTSLVGDTVLQAGNNTSAALEIQNASGVNELDFDTTSNTLNLTGTLNITGIEAPASATLTKTTTGGTLANSTTYYYLVAAVSGGSYTQATQPSPTSETTSNATSLNTLTWTPSEGAVAYDIFRSINAGTDWYVNPVLVSSSLCSSTTCTFIDNGSNYAWTELGYPTYDYNSTGDINLSDNSAINFGNDGTISDYDTGAQLQIAAVNSIYLSAGQVAWQDSADGYHVALQLDGGGGDGDAYFSNSVNNTSAFEILQSNDTTALLNADTENMRISVDSAYSAMGAPTGVSVLSTATTGGALGVHDYYYEITALDGSDGETPFSSEVSHNFTSGTTNEVKLQWTSVCGATAYRIYRGTSSGGETGYYETVGVSSNTTNFTCGSATLGLLTYTDTGAPQGNTTATTPSTTAAYISDNNSNNEGQLSVGGLGAPTGQVYVSGTIPTSPVGSVSAADAAQMVVEGNYAYVCNQAATPTLQIFNIANPEAPYVDGSVGISADCTGLAVSGHYAYVLNNNTDAIQVFDVSDPYSPTLLNTVTTGGNSSWQVLAQGGYLYVSNAGTTSNGVEIYSIANPALPVLVYEIAAPEYINDIAVANNYLYAFGNSEVYVYNISNPVLPVSDGTFTSTEMDNEFGYVYDGYLYSDNYGDATMQIYDIANPAAPTLMSTLPTGTDPNLASFSGNYMYLNNEGSNQIQVIDIANPSTPVILGDIPTQTSPLDDPVQGRYLYSIGLGNVMQIFDLGGTYTQALQAGATVVTSLTVGNDSTFIGNVNIQGSTTIGQSLNVNGALNIGGPLSGQIINDTETATGSHVYNTTGVETVPAYGYNFYTHLASNTVTSQTFNITGLANVEGTTAYIELEQTTTGADSVTSIVEINGTSVLQMVSTATGTYYDDAILMYNGTSWRIIGQGPHSTTQPTYTNAADYAEWIDYAGDNAPQPGDVLSIDPGGDSVVDSSSPYDNNLIGVVSTSPYEVGGVDDGHSVILSLTGRVPVNVSLENGPIAVGDPLTSSSTPGVAMKATGPGNIIGTALEAYDGTEDSSQIEVQLHVGYDDPTDSSGLLQGDTTVDGNLTINGNASISDDLTVAGTVAAGNLDVSGTTTLNNLTVNGLTSVASLSTQGDITINGHIITAGNTPTVAAGQTAGTGANVTLTGNDDSGTITIVTGTGATAGDLADITFAKSYAVAPHVSFTPGNSTAAALQYYRSVTTTGFSLNANSSNGQPADNTTYIFDYQIEQ